MAEATREESGSPIRFRKEQRGGNAIEKSEGIRNDAFNDDFNLYE